MILDNLNSQLHNSFDTSLAESNFSGQAHMDKKEMI
jgi:hypothetical protein